MYPEDPSIPVGRYHHSTCDYFCNKPSYYREIEEGEPHQVVEHVHRHSDMSKKEFDLLQQVVLKTEYLDKKVNELYEKRKGTQHTIK